MAVARYKTLNTNGIDQMVTAAQVGGAASAGQIPALDNTTGKFDPTMMPTGIGADTVVVPASEALAAGALVNLYNNSGVETARNADNTAANAGKLAMGFVLAAVASGANATVYLNGVDSSLSGLTVGPAFLGAAGAVTSTPPTAAGTVVQPIGDNVSASSLHFARGTPTIN